ncbi:sulfite exporter TauE/SafE family protein [Desulfobacter curvatus]|uniref:sulfite exporter TauE/SafE family protein n=1 Tax=Desulfobacter curvatus TaxID=2290 RepID=UPI0003700AEE|nr:sulfite exporter TauE/SafE family protein [Desulfobacter curvatus]
MPALIAITLIILALSFIFAMLGLGGAMLYIPVFHWFSFDFKSVAIPTGLLLNGITALSASVYYLKEKMVDVRGAVPLIISSFIAAPLGAYFTRMVSTDILILLFAAAMLFTGEKMLISSGQPEKTEMMPIGKRMTIMGVAGFFIGFIAGLLGVGGGFLFVPMMIAMGYQTKIAAATSAFVVIFSSFSGFAGHVAEGHFDWTLMVVTSIAVIIGSQVGAKVMKEKMKAKWIKQMFAIVLLGVAAKLIWKLYA